MMFFIGIFQQGMLYSLVGMGIFISFRILRIPDLTADGAFVLGGAVSAVFVLRGNPVLGIFLAFTAGMIAGSITCFLQTGIHILPVLSGFLTMSGLYSLNIAVQGGASNISLLGQKTLFDCSFFGTRETAKIFLPCIISLCLLLLLSLFFYTRLGLCLCAVGNNPSMARSMGISEERGRLLGLALSNGCVAMAGGLISQYQGYSDINGGAGNMLTGLTGIILGETLIKPKKMRGRLFSSAVGVIIYQMLMGITIRYNIFPAYFFKLLSVILIVITMGIVHKKEE